jgi:recombinational DNA repair ATPase RecF
LAKASERLKKAANLLVQHQEEKAQSRKQKEQALLKMLSTDTSPPPQTDSTPSGPTAKEIEQQIKDSPSPRRISGGSDF